VQNDEYKVRESRKLTVDLIQNSTLQFSLFMDSPDDQDQWFSKTNSLQDPLGHCQQYSKAP